MKPTVSEHPQNQLYFFGCGESRYPIQSNGHHTPIQSSSSHHTAERGERLQITGPGTHISLVSGRIATRLATARTDCAFAALPHRSDVDTQHVAAVRIPEIKPQAMFTEQQIYKGEIRPAGREGNHIPIAALAPAHVHVGTE